MPKLPTNLSVDPIVMERGRAYGQQHGTSVSQLVGDFLANLPSEEPSPEFSPIVELLYGIATPPSRGQKVDRADALATYRRHLDAKYGSGHRKK
jgi:hypothetical protein